MYNLLSFISPKDFGDYENKEKLTPEEIKLEIDELKPKLKDHMLRRRKADVFKVCHVVNRTSASVS